jgi:hypothetical protein
MNDRQFKIITWLFSMLGVLIILGITLNIIFFTNTTLKVKIVTESSKVDTVFVKNPVITLQHPDFMFNVNVATVRGYEPAGYKDKDGNIILATINEK